MCYIYLFLLKNLSLFSLYLGLKQSFWSTVLSERSFSMNMLNMNMNCCPVTFKVWLQCVFEFDSPEIIIND